MDRLSSSYNRTVIIINNSVTVYIDIFGISRLNRGTIIPIIGNIRLQSVISTRHIKILIFISPVINISVHQPQRFTDLSNIRRLGAISIIKGNRTQQCFLVTREFFYLTLIKCNIEIRRPRKILILDIGSLQCYFQTSILHFTDIQIGRCISGCIRKISLKQQISCKFMIQIYRQCYSIVKESEIKSEISLFGRFPFQILVFQTGQFISSLVTVPKRIFKCNFRSHLSQ